MTMQIAVATDGSEAAAGALHLALVLAERHGAAVDVLSVLEPLSRYASVVTEAAGQPLHEFEECRRAAHRRHLADQLRALGPAAAAWPLETRLGAPAPTIVEFARDRAATLLVLGLGRHGLAERWLGTETALRVMRLAHVPVLAAPEWVRELPRQAVVAIDFSEFSRDAAAAAAGVLAPGGELHLALVLWPVEEIGWSATHWARQERERLAGELDALGRSLQEQAAARVRTHVLAGDPARELLHLAEWERADLIAAGSHGAGFFGRILMGSVSTRLVRGATCSVLIAPPRTVPRELEETRQEMVSPEASGAPCEGRSPFGAAGRPIAV
jgi:nucleotide-binding universal stress UspA family protein